MRPTPTFDSQKVLAARYSVGSPGSAPAGLYASSFRRCLAPKALDVLEEEDHAQDNLFVFRRLYDVAEGVGGSGS